MTVGVFVPLPGNRWYAIKYIYGSGRWTWSVPMFRDFESALAVRPDGSELWAWNGATWVRAFP